MRGEFCLKTQSWTCWSLQSWEPPNLNICAAQTVQVEKWAPCCSSRVGCTSKLYSCRAMSFPSAFLCLKVQSPIHSPRTHLHDMFPNTGCWNIANIYTVFISASAEQELISYFLFQVLLLLISHSADKTNLYVMQGARPDNKKKTLAIPVTALCKYLMMHVIASAGFLPDC